MINTIRVIINILYEQHCKNKLKDILQINRKMLKFVYITNIRGIDK